MRMNVAMSCTDRNPCVTKGLLGYYGEGQMVHKTPTTTTSTTTTETSTGLGYFDPPCLVWQCDAHLRTIITGPHINTSAFALVSCFWISLVFKCNYRPDHQAHYYTFTSSQAHHTLWSAFTTRLTIIIHPAYLPKRIYTCTVHIHHSLTLRPPSLLFISFSLFTVQFLSLAPFLASFLVLKKPFSLHLHPSMLIWINALNRQILFPLFPCRHRHFI
jgi:hypothetical protein